MSGEECVRFLQWALPRLGMRWAGFRKVRGQVCKRTGRRLGELGLSGYDDYRGYLDSHPEEWSVLDSFCRVTISRFHRDRGVFELVRDLLLPELAAAEAGGPREHRGRAGLVRCWSAGCASGEEPYTLSIIWRLAVGGRYPGVGLRVVATDVDETLIARARTGCYPRSALKELASGWVEAAFEPVGDELCLRPQFRPAVELSLQDIREQMPPGPFHLVLCRNLVFTYFEEPLQGRLLDRILERLLPGGFLVIGAHEELPAGDWPLERLVAGAPVFKRGEAQAFKRPVARGT